MEFTNKAYEGLLDLLNEYGYSICDYKSYENYKRSVILRHDIDFSLQKGVELAEIEYKRGIASTYFVLLSTNFYNVFSKESNEMLKKIIDMGHEIGLHFDEKRYNVNNSKDLEYYVSLESEILGKSIRKEIKTVSMHRPSKWILENDIQFSGFINSYSKKFLLDFKYLSDSRMHWREDVMEIIKSEQYDKLHILSHPFWYSDKVEKIKDKLMRFLNDAKTNRYDSVNSNFRDLSEHLKWEDIN
jgi:hypothetical protein